MTRNERKLKSIEDEMGRYSTEIKAIWTKADEEDRETTPEERGEVEERLKAIEDLKANKEETEASIKVEKQVAEHAKELGSTEDVVVGPERQEPEPQMKSLGEQFLESKQYKQVFEHGAPGGSWSTGEIKLDAKGTLLSGGTVAGAASPYDYQAGIVETLFQRLTVADLLATGTTTSPQVRYNRETSATSGAAGVAEGEAKPESSLAFTEVTEAVKKIATILPVSEEMLEDVAQIEAYINQRLSLFIKIEEERELLRGAGGGNGVQGIIGRSGVNTFKAGTATTISDHIFNVANNTRGSSFLEPDGIVMNPEQWAKVRLAKDTSGQYYGGGPFYGAYGGPQGPAGASQLQQGENIWGLRVIVTSAVGAGTALIGAFRQGAQVFRRSGLTVEASNSHEDFFRRNLTAIRAEERLALAVYRPSAFTTVTFE